MILIHYLDSYTGASRAAMQILKSKRVDTVIYGKTIGGGFITDFLKCEKNISSIPIDVNKDKSVKTLLKIQLSIFFKLFKFKKFKKTILLNSINLLAPILYCIFFNKKSIIWIHEQRLNNSLLNFFSKILLKKFKGKFFYSSSFLKKEYNYEGNVLSPHVNQKFYSFFRKRNSIKNVLMVTSLTEYKGVNMFVQLANKFYYDNNFKINFILILSTNNKIGKAYFESRSINITKNITLIYSPKNIEEYYNSSDILLNLTNRDVLIESYGLAIAESLTVGMPVLCPNVGGPLEIMNLGERCGLFVDERNLEDIEKKLIYLLNNNNIFKKYSSNTYLYRDRFSQKVFLKKLSNILHIHN